MDQRILDKKNEIIGIQEKIITNQQEMIDNCEKQIGILKEIIEKQDSLIDKLIDYMGHNA